MRIVGRKKQHERISCGKKSKAGDLEEDYFIKSAPGCMKEIYEDVKLI